jgi:hypothetical protein
MTEQNPNPDIAEDTEGHLRKMAAAGPDDVEGLERDDDTEGHTRRPAMDVGDDDDDVEGHLRKSR